MFSDVSASSPQYVTYLLIGMTQSRMLALLFDCRVKCWCEKQGIEGLLHLALYPEKIVFSPDCQPLLSQKVDMSNYRQKTHPCWSKKASRTLRLWESSALCNSLDDNL